MCLIKGNSPFAESLLFFSLDVLFLGMQMNQDETGAFFKQKDSNMTALY
jgi:hypothetical protein